MNKKKEWRRERLAFLLLGFDVRRRNPTKMARKP
jgi:hypothetical protein